MTRHRFANEIVVDHQKNEIRIDGVAFPYWTQPDPEIELIREHGRNLPAVLHIGIYADNLTYVSPDGQARVMRTATAEAESEWTKRRAKEIVLEGLADVVEWLGQCELERQRNAPGPTSGSL